MGSGFAGLTQRSNSSGRPLRTNVGQLAYWSAAAARGQDPLRFDGCCFRHRNHCGRVNFIIWLDQREFNPLLLG
jgi:hypothetical protein